MKVLILGLGSIAQKHIDALRFIDLQTKIFALRSNKTAKVFQDVTNIFSWEDIPKDINFVIISNPTSEHFKSIKQSIQLNIPLFIEKPPLMELDNVDELIELIKDNNIRTYVAFNLRFHPAIQWLKRNLPLNKVFEVQTYCGSYLPEWRPGKDYKEVYSAKKTLGGGVHLDLIHELDYVRWIFGEPDRVISYKGKKSHLDIDSIDVANYILEYKNHFITILLNYYRRDPKRSIEIVFEDRTWVVDLIKASINEINGNELFHAKNYELTDTYVTQMQYFIENIYKDNFMMNDLEESIKTLKICLG